MKPFQIAATPSLHFGVGAVGMVGSASESFGNRVLLVTGARSFDTNGGGITESLHRHGLTVKRVSIDREPTPDMVDAAVESFHAFAPQMVVAAGGGSVLDAGKAIAAMMPLRAPVKNYLEGVGKLQHPGAKIPFIAVPTTAGTGSEATKNAVLSETGEHGFKRSLRHNCFVPNVAIVDPQLTVSCPRSVTAASGMDAFTQLLESFLSTAANPFTDALAMQGLQCIARSLPTAWLQGDDLAARTDVALAAYLSGITLANAGLGLVHGFASSIGGRFPVAHGVICSRLMAPANTITVRKLRLLGKGDTLAKYAAAARLFSKKNDASDAYHIDAFLDLLRDWTTTMGVPKLSEKGVPRASHQKIAERTDNKNNPVDLTPDEMAEVLELAG